MSYQGSERDEFQDDRQLRASFDWKRHSGNNSLQLLGGWNYSRMSYVRSTTGFNFVNEDARSSEYSYFSNLKNSLQIDEKTNLAATFDLNYHRVNSLNRIDGSGYGEERMESGIMVKVQRKSSERYTTFFLVRSEYYDGRIIPLIPGVGAEWKIFNNIPAEIHWNIARNFHKPTLNDLYWIPGGNPGLKPEDGITGDLTLRMMPTKNKFNSELTGFVSRIENWIVWQPAQNGAYYWEAANLKEVFSRGIEYQGSVKFSAGAIRLVCLADYSFTRTTNLNAGREADLSRGKQLIYIPKHRANLNVSAGLKSYTVDYSLGYTGRRYTKSNNQESDFEQVLNPYFLSNLSLIRKFNFKGLEADIKLKIENLFNTSYQAILWRPMPGRSFYLTLAINCFK